MDPDACLSEIRTILSEGPDGDTERLIDLVRALDEWLTSGGFKPAAWNRGA